MKLETEQFQNELDYGVSVRLAKEMLTAGLINRQEFARIDKMYVQRYRPIFENIPAPKPQTERQD